MLLYSEPWYEREQKWISFTNDIELYKKNVEMCKQCTSLNRDDCSKIVVILNNDKECLNVLGEYINKYKRKIVGKYGGEVSLDTRVLLFYDLNNKKKEISKELEECLGFIGLKRKISHQKGCKNKN